MGNYLHIGPVAIRYGSRNLAKWGFERLRVGGLAMWSRSNSGDLILASYHPRSSLYWHWSVCITNRTRGYHKIFSHAELRRRAELHAAGNQYVGRPRWFHRFYQPDTRRVSQWHDYVRLPFGFCLLISRQDYHKRPQFDRKHKEAGE
ncbi:hypothetical protein [Sphingobium chungbukense]|uniref:Uncharacterized protein n=1 Tax=Sphingobium chungbukense TaxID=56193 RepID=A0A0M3AVR4_9SPHN|nr:hypothetical protein [Sphingobium chungbukense]KKW92669.1 hypothetical protein YP76_06965 [Sphingobium chungbukense]